MPRRGRHRTTTPVRIAAAAAAVLVTGGIVVAAGSASAHTDSGSDSGDGSGLVSTLTDSLGASGRDEQASDGSDDQGSGDEATDDQESDEQESDEQASDGETGGDDTGDDEQFKGRDQAAPPDASDFVDIREVEPGTGDGRGGRFSAAGTFRTDCGTNADGAHRNSDNIVLGPGKRNAAQHVHDYVGTTATTFASSDEELRSAETTCGNGDRSTYYWPVIRDLNATGPDAFDDGGGLDGNFGAVLPATSVDLTFHGNPTEEVVAAPDGLRLATGDAKAGTNGDENANARWTCTGFEDRTTTQYPLCPEGTDLVRLLDFPSCWDGQNTDSDDHRSHVAFPEEDGSCADGTEPIPALRMTLTYDRPDGRAFALDSFPEQQHAPETDHASSINLMPEDLMDRAVRCINDGQAC